MSQPSPQAVSGSSSSLNAPLPQGSVDELARVFNSALVATRANAARDFSGELFALVETPAFRAILAAVRNLSRSQGISDREAAETLVETFRKIDGLWSAYVFQEGVDRLRSPSGL